MKVLEFINEIEKVVKSPITYLQEGITLYRSARTAEYWIKWLSKLNHNWLAYNPNIVKGPMGFYEFANRNRSTLASDKYK